MKRDCQCVKARHQHGSYGAYHVDKCRCFPCRLANSRAKNARDNGTGWREMVPTAGTRRRIEALHRAGYTGGDLGRALGVHANAVQQLRTGYTVVKPSTAAAIAALFEDLTARPYPTGWLADRTRRWAERNDWPLPLAYDSDTIDDPDPAVDAAARAAMNPNAPTWGDDELDEVAVERYIAGTLKHPEFQRYSAELIEAVRILAGRGLPDTEISERVGVHKRRIQGLRAEHGIPAGVAA